MPQLGSRKSRNGCKRCKQRRVKCDEQVPCGGCSRRGETCSFLEVTFSASSDVAGADRILPWHSEDWTLDLTMLIIDASELMHHYTTVLYQLGAPESVVHLWRFYIPQQAFKHTFLLHGLLAFTALHLAYLRPDSSFRYLQLCDKHQAIALERFRSIISTRIDPELADALLALSVTLALSSMARSCAVSTTATMEMEDVAEWFILTKGIGNVIRLSSEHIRKGPMAIMLERRLRPEGTECQLPPSISARFEALQYMLISYELEPEAQEDCRFALTQLEELYKNICYLSPKVDLQMSDFSPWQVDVSMGFVRLIQARSPPALIVLAYYAAAITAIHTAWYTHNWADYALNGISQALDDDMQHFVKWPLEQLKAKMSELGVQSSLHGSTFDDSFTKYGLAT